MKKVLLLLSFLSIVTIGFAQVKQPAQWKFSAKKINATTYEIHLTAALQSGWHIYSQSTPDGGPVATTIKVSPNPLVTISGAAKEVGKLEKKHEELFGVEVKQFSNTVDFVQTVTLKGKVKTTVSGSINFMACNDRECLPPTTQKFSVALQ